MCMHTGISAGSCTRKARACTSRVKERQINFTTGRTSNKVGSSWPRTGRGLALPAVQRAMGSGGSWPAQGTLKPALLNGRCVPRNHTTHPGLWGRWGQCRTLSITHPGEAWWQVSSAKWATHQKTLTASLWSVDGEPQNEKTQGARACCKHSGTAPVSWLFSAGHSPWFQNEHPVTSGDSLPATPPS